LVRQSSKVARQGPGDIGIVNRSQLSAEGRQCFGGATPSIWGTQRMPMNRSGLGQIFATYIAQRIARMWMTRTSSPLEIRRRHQQIKERRSRGVALDRVEHVSLHQWAPFELGTLRQVAPKTVTNRANATRQGPGDIGVVDRPQVVGRRPQVFRGCDRYRPSGLALRCMTAFHCGCVLAQAPVVGSRS
jgi:hypothetical protein